MDASPLTASVEADAAVGRIGLAGRIDRGADAPLTSAYARATASGAPVVVLDFSAVDYINSTGIALIVRLLAEARRDRRTVRAFGLTDHYVQIFEITRLSDYMAIHGDEASAMAGEAPAAAGGRA